MCTRLLPGRQRITLGRGRRILPGMTPGRTRRAWLRAGIVLFAVGLVFVAIDVLPFLAGDRDTPLWLNLACLLAPLGFAVTVGTALRGGRAEQRAAMRELSDR